MTFCGNIKNNIYIFSRNPVAWRSRSREAIFQEQCFVDILRRLLEYEGGNNDHLTEQDM